MSKFDHAINIIDRKIQYVPLSFYFVTIPSGGAVVAIINGAGWEAIYFFIAGFLTMVVHAFFIFKLVSAELEEPHRYSWIIRLIFVGIYVISIPLLLFYFIDLISIAYYGGVTPV